MRILRNIVILFIMVIISAVVSRAPVSAGELSHVWSQSFGDAASQVVTGRAVDPSGNIVIVGYFEGTVNFGGSTLVSAGDRDIFVAKFDTTGNHLWSRSFGDPDYQSASDVTFDAAGNVVFSGRLVGTVDFGGEPVFLNYINPYLVKLNAAGGHVCAAQ